MLSLSAQQLRAWQAEGKDFGLIDVREAEEHAQFNIGGKLIPLGNIISGADGIPTMTPVVIYCEKGIRSVIAIQRLEGLGFINLYNLSGGMKAWKAL